MAIDVTNKMIGSRIKILRIEQGMTQQQLADEIGKTVSSVRKYEKGLVSIPSEVLSKISYALGASSVYFYGAESYKDDIFLSDSDSIMYSSAYMCVAGLLRSFGYAVNEMREDTKVLVCEEVYDDLKEFYSEEQLKKGFVVFPKKERAKITNKYGISIELSSSEVASMLNEIEEFIEYIFWKQTQKKKAKIKDGEAVTDSDDSDNLPF